MEKNTVDLQLMISKTVGGVKVKDRTFLMKQLKSNLRANFTKIKSGKITTLNK